MLMEVIQRYCQALNIVSVGIHHEIWSAFTMKSS